MQDVYNQNKHNLVSALKKSGRWYSAQVRLLMHQNITPNFIMKGNAKQLQSKIVIGNMYHFIYDPKWKDILPYFDTFPLVFPFANAAGGFLGLNFHYLPVTYRIRLLDNLLIFRNNDRLDETTKLKFSWQMINNVARFSGVEACIKHYLVDHVRSQFRKVEPNDWVHALLLPVEQFQKASKGQVWKDSRRKM